MASGSKNYFRHYNGARNDEVLVEAMDKFGPKAYFFWFALVEMCAELSEDGIKDQYVFHQSRLYKELRCTKHTLNLCLTYFQDRFRIDYTYVEPMFNIRIPNLLKYLGSYQNKSPNKKKVNEIKIKESKIKEIQIPKTEVLEFQFSESFDPSQQKKAVAKIEKKINDQTHTFIKAYCESFKQRWDTNPLIQGKQRGIAKRLSSEMSFERFRFLLQKFFEMPDAWLVKQKHPLELFESKLNEIVVFADLGEFQTQTKTVQSDKFQSVKDQLRRIEEGKL